MTSTPPPPSGPQSGGTGQPPGGAGQPPGAPPRHGPPPGPPPGYPGQPYYVGPQPEGRSTAFWVAVFLGLLLLISGAVNVLFLILGLIGSASGLGTPLDEEQGFRTVVVAHKEADSATRILRVPIVGAIAENMAPVIGAAGGTVSQVRRALKLARKDSDIKAVLFDINSPGGGVGDSDEIWRLIKDFRAETKKPVVALFGDVAASGGYYIAAACDQIYCRPTSITGSIGVIISTYEISQALEKIGVKAINLISPDTPYKDILSPTRAMKEDEREKIIAIVQEMYERFVDVVAQGRPLDKRQVKSLANGLIYSAKQAQQNGLVDKILDQEQAHAEILKMIDKDGAQVVEQRRMPGLGDLLFGARSNVPTTLNESVAAMLFRNTGSRFLYFWPGGR